MIRDGIPCEITLQIKQRKISEDHNVSIGLQSMHL